MPVRVSAAQAAVCARFNAVPSGVGPRQKAGVARNVLGGLMPVNGVRYRPEGDASGWYIWAGEGLSDDPGFFVPLHARHLGQWCPAVIPYPALPPGWRFLIAPGWEDAWPDDSLLQPRNQDDGAPGQ